MPGPHRLVVLLGLGLALAGCALAQRVPEDGRYDGEMCVATGSNPPSCGPVEALLSHGVARVRVSDIVYRMFLKDGRLDMVLLHGSMQIDGFSAPYSWQQRVLQFADPDRPVRYRIRFGEPARAPG